MQGFTSADPVPDTATSPGTDDDGGDVTGTSPRHSATWDRQSSLTSSSSYCSHTESSDVEYGGHPLQQSEIEEIPSPRWLSPLPPLWIGPIHCPRIIPPPWRMTLVVKVYFHDNTVRHMVFNKVRSLLLGGKTLNSSYDKARARKAMKSLVQISGISSIAMDMKDRKMTVIGVADPMHIVGKLRKLWHTEIVSIGPAKEPKKEEPKKEEPKKEEPKKEPAVANYEKILDMYRTHPYMNTHYVVYNAEEDPNACSVM